MQTVTVYVQISYCGITYEQQHNILHIKSMIFCTSCIDFAVVRVLFYLFIANTSTENKTKNSTTTQENNAEKNYKFNNNNIIAIIKAHT